MHLCMLSCPYNHDQELLHSNAKDDQELLHSNAKDGMHVFLNALQACMQQPGV